MKVSRYLKFTNVLLSAAALVTALPFLAGCGGTPATRIPTATTSATTSPAAPATTAVTSSPAATATTTVTTSSAPSATTTTSGPATTTPSPTATTTAPTTTPAPTTTEPTATETPTATPQVVEKEIRSTSFIEGTFTIPAGTTVVWTNRDSLPHTVSARDGSFESGTLNTSGTFQFTFATPGTYEYFCRIHPFMTGTITVTAS